MNKLLAMLVAGVFVASSTLALAQTPATPATPATPPAASSGAMNHDHMTKKAKKKRAKKKAVRKEDKMIKSNTSSANTAVKSAPATGGAAMKDNMSGMKPEAKGK